MKTANTEKKEWNRLSRVAARRVADARGMSHEEMDALYDEIEAASRALGHERKSANGKATILHALRKAAMKHPEIFGELQG